jgi:hypothetical protein
MLPIPLILVGILVRAQTPKPVILLRTWTVGDTFAYEIHSHMHVERRGGVIRTWLPQDIDLSYDSSAVVIGTKPGGISIIKYKRPTVIETSSETATAPAKSEKINLGLEYSLTLSPINEILAENHIASAHKLTSRMPIGLATGKQSPVAPYISEVYTLARNLGSLDNSLDFSPKLPVDEVVPGDTWKHTVGYSPQALSDNEGKSAVQRMDYTYTFEGTKVLQGKPVYRIAADMELKTDLADFYFSVSGDDRDSSLLQNLPLSLKMHIDFDVDIKTCRTIRAVSNATGGFSVIYRTDPSVAVHEEKFKSVSTMLLKSAS